METIQRPILCWKRGRCTPASRGPVTLSGALLQPGPAVSSTGSRRALRAYPADPRVWPAVISWKKVTFRVGGHHLLRMREGPGAPGELRAQGQHFALPGAQKSVIFGRSVLWGCLETHAVKLKELFPSSWAQEVPVPVQAHQRSGPAVRQADEGFVPGRTPPAPSRLPLQPHRPHARPLLGAGDL